MSRVPKGYVPVECYTNGVDFVVLGQPHPDDPEHNCDAAGCSTFGHVLYRGSTLSACGVLALLVAADADATMFPKTMPRIDAIRADLADTGDDDA
jgi:hypothetical protein